MKIIAVKVFQLIKAVEKKKNLKKFRLGRESNPCTGIAEVMGSIPVQA